MIFLVSCASQKNQDYNDVTGSMVVDWNVENDRVVPKIEEGAPHENEYGPTSSEAPNKVKKKIENELPMALMLGPGGYRTLSYLSLLKELHLRGETPHVIIGHGLGAVLAAYYAFGYKPDYIEWKLFKFTKKAKDAEIYTKEWLNLVEEFLIDDLVGKKIEQGKLTLVIPVYSRTDKTVRFLKRGDLKDTLMANVDLLSVRSLAYRPAFYTERISKKILKELGIGKIMIVDLLVDGINWKKGKGLLNGHYQKAAQLTKDLKIEDKIMITYPLGKYPIDDLSGVADLLYRSKQLSRNKISEWILSKTKESETKSN